MFSKGQFTLFDLFLILENPNPVLVSSNTSDLTF